MMRLEEFLERIFSLSTGECKPVWVYEQSSNFYPDVEGSADLICAFKSDYTPSTTLKPEICALAVKEIYWTDKGIAVAVEWKG